MVLVLSSSQLSTITKHCEQAYPNEACGILIGKTKKTISTVEKVIPTKNAREPHAQYHRYSIPARDLLHGEEIAEAENLLVIGYFHSHPGHPANPSSTDLEAAWPGYSYLIVSVFDGHSKDIYSWRLQQDRSKFEQEIIRLDHPVDQA